MDKREQDILKKIEEKTADIDVPESLNPEAVQDKLMDTKKKTGWTPGRITALAASLCVVAAVGVMIGMMNRDSQSGNHVQTTARESAEEKGLAVAESHEQLFALVEEYNNEMYKGQKNNDAILQESDEIAQYASPESKAVTDGYSQTNVRQEGVDEADIVKTDGKYLYVLKDNRQEVVIVDANAGKMELRGTIKIEEGYVEEFYLNAQQKKLILISSISGTNGDVMPLARDIYGGEQTTEALTYDISDVSAPKKDGVLTQSGSYTSSRMSGNYLYLFSHYVARTEISKSDKSTFIPSVNDKILPSESIYMPSAEKADMYEVITAVDIKTPDKVADSKAIFSKGGELYVSNENIYFYEVDAWQNEKKESSVCKVSYKDGKLRALARGKIDGFIKDSFCIDEYEGNLRVVTTQGDVNAVYVLNRELKVIGAIENLAKDERVYSARFMGDTGYFVTFRETDPLFSVDLSNPEKPKIVGELKIPGFSDYLHFYGEDQLLGIGMSVDEKTQSTDGVKLSMFDISNKADVKEADTYVIENVYSTDVSYDYKAALVDPQKNMIGFAGYKEGGQNYFIFSYDKEKGFTKQMEEEINGSMMISPRGVYIEDVLYVVEGNIIEAYSLKEYKKVGDIIL